MTEDAKVVKGLEAIGNDHDARERPTAGIGDIAGRLQEMNDHVESLVKRIDTLEQLNQRIWNENVLTEGKKDDAGETAPQVPREEQTKIETPSVDLKKGPQAEPEDFLSKHIEVREEVWTDGKYEWMPLDSSKRTSHAQRKTFRYDTDKNGNVVFSVFQGSKLYVELYKLCNPAHHGQVNEREGRLEMADLNPLLRARGQLKTLEESLGGTQSNEAEAMKEELRVMFQLYERQDGHLSHLYRAQERLNQMLETSKWDWKSLKGLFHINQLVVFRELRDEWAVARVTMVSSNEDSAYSIMIEGLQLQLECEAIDFDGKRYRAHVYKKKIPQFAGSKNITELPVYPLENSLQEDTIRKDSKVSGEKWIKLIKDLENAGPRGAVVRQYQGYCETFGQDADDHENGGRGSMLAGRVIVDPTRFPDRLLRFTKDNRDPFESKDNLKCDENLILCPEQILVHSLSDNEWYYVAMSRLEEPQWNKDAWARLVKPRLDERVAMSIDRIQKLAIAHQSQNLARAGETMDNFKGKGKGLTFLLHGSPGVGKTMLAECLSEDRKRPLYRINLGRLIGDDRWESRIEEIFRQAHLWDAILLVDEAEVILAERTQENMHQSAWVAVFLRKIEYFEGIIFLTTNLIHMIDPAFISRVNLGIKIPDLDDGTRLDIWKKVLGENIRGGKKLSAKTELVQKWANQDLNGRQIRNVVLSASLMASTEKCGSDLKEIHIREALEDVLSFKGMIDEEKETMQQKYMSQWS